MFQIPEELWIKPSDYNFQRSNHSISIVHATNTTRRGAV